MNLNGRAGAMSPIAVCAFSLFFVFQAEMAMAGERPAIAVAVPSQAGTVSGKPENSDAFIWKLFVQTVAPATAAKDSPAMFESWASDADTFSKTPRWPDEARPLKLHRSILEQVKRGQPLASLRALTIDVQCGSPRGRAVGGFPSDGTPSPCIAEQVARNRAEFDYIVKNNLNTQAGLAAAYKNGLKVDMPTDSIAVKGDWIPLPTLLQWVPQLHNMETIRKLYYIISSSGVEFALVSMHVSSRQNPDWVWATFEHEMNPGRCDYIGCFDSFGARLSAVPPNKLAVNTQYGSCKKTDSLNALMTKAKLPLVWEHYCLKATQVDFTAADGTPYALGNSVIEGIVGNGTVAASSCISCHAYASFGPAGTPAPAAAAVLPFNPTGKIIPGVLSGSHTFAFNWGLLLAPK